MHTIDLFPSYTEGLRGILSALGFGRNEAREVEKAPFRSRPLTLSGQQVVAMLKDKDFFDTEHNSTGKGFPNAYDLVRIGGDSVVIDKASRLQWQCSGSDLTSSQCARETIQALNGTGHAGYHDWRLPTLPEAMTLLEPGIQEGWVYVSPLFDRTQRTICTCDIEPTWRLPWLVDLNRGFCGWKSLGYCSYVRAVRSI